MEYLFDFFAGLFEIAAYAVQKLWDAAQSRKKKAENTSIKNQVFSAVISQRVILECVSHTYRYGIPVVLYVKVLCFEESPVITSSDFKMLGDPYPGQCS